MFPLARSVWCDITSLPLSLSSLNIFLFGCYCLNTSMFVRVCISPSLSLSLCWYLLSCMLLSKYLNTVCMCLHLSSPLISSFLNVIVWILVCLYVSAFLSLLHCIVSILAWLVCAHVCIHPSLSIISLSHQCSLQCKRHISSVSSTLMQEWFLCSCRPCLHRALSFAWGEHCIYGMERKQCNKT